MPQANTMKVEKARALASFVPATWDDEKRTVDVIVSTGAAVRRYDYWHGEYYDEELAIEEGAIRMDRLNNGAAVLNSHSQWDLGDQIGVVERAWIEDGKLMATLRLSAREDIAGIVQDIRDGIIRNISVGYIPHTYEKIESTGKIAVKRAIDWEPTEVSFVPVPADPGAQARSANAQPHLYEVRVITRDNPTAAPSAPSSEGASPLGATQQEDTRNMDEQQQNQGGTQQAPAPAVDTEAIRAEATKAERFRVSEIRTLSRMAKLPEEFANDLIERGVSLDEAREQIKARWAEQGSAPIRNVHVGVTRDEGETRRQGMEDAILLRLNPGARLASDEASHRQAVERAREFRNMGVLRMAEEMLAERGENVRHMSRLEIATRSLQSTSDFPAILANVANKRLRDIPPQVPTTFRVWARRGPNAPDFKEIYIPQISAAPDFQELAEGGEVKYGSLKEGNVITRVITYARGLRFSRQAMVNDDLRAFDAAIRTFGAAGERLQNRLVYKNLTDNPVMPDGKTLFHADHGNVASAAAISVTSLGEGRGKMRQQRGLQGEILNIAPAFLIVPSTLEQLAYQYTSGNYVPAKSSDINEFRAGGRTALEPIVEAELDATSTSQWYLAGDGISCDTVEYFYLDGAEGVSVESEIDFDTEGLKIRGRLDFGTTVVDHRGLFRNG